METHRPGQPPSKLTARLRAKILNATRRKTRDGSTHWSCRKLAKELGISKDLVHRVWREADLKPHRLERYMASNDPDFERKAADIIGLYLDPPRHAAVFCVDEKTAIQALDRRDIEWRNRETPECPTLRLWSRRHAEIKFGGENSAAIAEWVEYWRETAARNIGLVEILSARTKVDFRNQTVLDVGCGTGGLAQVVAEQGGSYIGLDYYPAILEMAQAFLGDLPNSPQAALLRASGPSLPLRDASVDVVAAFDVIEHLVGGEPWQRAFLKEIRRVLRPDGVLLLTTPNRLHPFEPHARLYGPHYVPVSLADRYIRWRNPSFLREYSTYGEIHLLTPWKMKRLLEAARLRLIPDFPGGLPLETLFSPQADLPPTALLARSRLDRSQSVLDCGFLLRNRGVGSNLRTLLPPRSPF